MVKPIPLVTVITPYRNAARWLPGLVDGLSVMPLHNFNNEHTALVKWEPNTIFNPHQHSGGEEILVLEGVFHDEFGQWIRGRHHIYRRQT